MRHISAKSLMLLTLICVTLSCSVLTGCGSSKSEAVRLGALFPFSGSLARQGEETFRGAEIARMFVNEKGGIDGIPVEYVKGDAVDAKAAVSEAERLITVEKVPLIIGTYSSSYAYAASEVTERNKVVFWEVIAVSDALVTRGFEYFFKVNPLASQYGEMAAHYAHDVVAPSLGLEPSETKVYVFFEDTLYGTTIGAAASKVTLESGMKLVGSDSYTAATATDLSSLVLKIRAAEPDIIIATSYLNDGILFWRQSKELGLRPKAFIGTGAAYSHPDFVGAVGKDVNYLLNVDPFMELGEGAVAAEVQPSRSEFVDKFTQVYGYPPDHNAAVGFVGAWILLEKVLPNVEELTPDNIREAALELDIADGGTLLGYGVKIAGPGHPLAGENIAAYPCVQQWQDEELLVVYPEKFAVTQPQLPMPAWEDLQ